MKKAKPKIAKPMPKKFILIYNVCGEELRTIGTMAEIDEQLKVDSDNGELPEDENDIRVYEVARECDVKIENIRTATMVWPEEKK